MSFLKRREVKPEELTCGEGCRCERQFPLFDSNEAAFRATGVETKEEWANELMAQRAGLRLDHARIDRAGRCLMDWAAELRAEAQRLRQHELAIEEEKRVALEREEAERKEREADELREAAAKEVDRERRKTRFLGSFNDLKWL